MFIYYPLDAIKVALNCGNDKAVKLLAELDSSKGIGLIQRVKQGQGKSARIYVKRFTTRETPDSDNCPPRPEIQTSENRSVIILTRIRPKGAIPIHLSSH
ncbi:hypothetical protein D7X94_10415 [Acutalibacter sp. 1XD8-33]|uniref:hypothetical protein n=1 Tax=Acutalibacter sp. 1XD8-33 TaxID=2320081 RepID=UPI000EA14FE0|nr:hypothetical protein [Acutalibacter sp. 1XD8-33]RKJ39829.1 hypothetical protein D7X94_10415 [Acutalibacter sp. 1XD8-33]